MGMYTELYLGVDLKKDTPKELVKWLEAHNEDGNLSWEERVEMCPSELKGTRLSTIGGCSYYFYAQQHFYFGFDSIGKNYHLTLGFNIKNYDGEIKTLIDLLRPHLDMLDGEHMGHIRYEEDNEPTLLYV